MRRHAKLRRPNRGRTKSTVYLDELDRSRIRKLRELADVGTDAAAIRKALDLATREIRYPDTTTIGIEILRFADALLFTNEREKREIRRLGERLYKLLTRDERHAIERQLADRRSVRLLELAELLVDLGLAARSRRDRQVGVEDDSPRCYWCGEIGETDPEGDFRCLNSRCDR